MYGVMSRERIFLLLLLGIHGFGWRSLILNVTLGLICNIQPEMLGKNVDLEGRCKSITKGPHHL